MLGQSEAVTRTVVEQLKVAYFKLAYLQQTLTILVRDDQVLNDIEQIAESRYRVGKGNQQEVLKAQLQHTRILQEVNMNRAKLPRSRHRSKGCLAVARIRLMW